MSPNTWLVIPKPNPSALFRLFCFSYAGGGAVVFRTWPHDLPADVEVCAVQLPGRENRVRETPLSRMEQVVQNVAQAMQTQLNLPFAFFGHSLGGLICFEVARHLRREFGKAPERLFISARRAPHLREPLPPIHHLPEPQFVAEIRRRYNGIPQAVLQEPDLLRIMLPMMRADFAIFETYEHAEEEPLSCPITVFGGIHDATVNRAALEAWHQHTRNACTLHMLPGGHFFLRDEQESLLRIIGAKLQPELG